jgi:hypothetical protein
MTKSNTKGAVTNDKHSILLRYEINYDEKMYLSVGLNYLIIWKVNLYVFQW